MKHLASLAALALAITLPAAPALAQDGEIIVTAMRRSDSSDGPVIVPAKPPVIGLKRQADSAVRNIEIVSDSRDADMRRREVQAMLLAAIERAGRGGLSLVTGELEVTEVTRETWRDQFPLLAGKTDPNADEDDDDDDEGPPPVFEDDGSTATVRLKVKTRLDGSIANAGQTISAFVKGVPATGRSQIAQKGGLGLTIINPDQYRDEIYRRVAAGATHAAGFYGEGYGVTVNALDQAVAWQQVSNTEVFLYIPYTFTVSR